MPKISKEAIEFERKLKRIYLILSVFVYSVLGLAVLTLLFVLITG